MGVSGTLDYISDLMSNAGHKHKKTKQFQTVNIKVRMDCDGCELKVKKTLYSLSGVKSVEIDRKQQKVTVTGYIDDASKVLKKAKSTGKKAEMWPYVPYNLVAQPYAYDMKAPPGFVRRVEDYHYNISSTTAANKLLLQAEAPYIAAMFSDDNPNACSIM